MKQKEIQEYRKRYVKSNLIVIKLLDEIEKLQKALHQLGSFKDYQLSFTMDDIIRRALGDDENVDYNEPLDEEEK